MKKQYGLASDYEAKLARVMERLGATAIILTDRAVG